MKSIVFTILFLCVVNGIIKSQSVSNVIAKQKGEVIIVTYDLQCSDNVYVLFYILQDGKYNPTKLNRTGDAGADISSGSKTIIWNFTKDKEMLLTDKIIIGVKVKCKDEEFKAESQPFLLKIPVNIYVKGYVEEKIAIWQKKGEFEKTTDYQKRVNEASRNQQIQKFTDEAIIKMKNENSKKINWKYLKLSLYDADNETFLIESEDFGQFAFPVPVSDAQSFKNNWSNLTFSEQDFYVNDNMLALAKLTISNPANKKKYCYDSKQQTTYSANNITYNFKPIEVNIQQDNVFNNNLKLTEKNTNVGVSEVDINIPVNAQKNDKTFVVIIANENYTREVQVQFASNDGKIFKEYCEKTLGIPSKNIHYSQDATYGTMKSEIKWICDVAQAYNGQARILFYYAGHGMPNELEKTAYLLPVDGFSTDYETAIKLDELYNRLNSNPSQSVTVFLDACFSGSVRDNGMLANARGVKIRPKTEVPKGKMVVFSAATGDETAYPFKEKQHGLFTFFLLKKLQETKGDVNYQTLSNYITENVKQQSIVVNQKSQTPQVITSQEIQETWKLMNFK